MINISHRQLGVPALPPDKVPKDCQAKSTKRCCTAPIDERVPEEEVLDGVIVPATHAKTHVQNRPLPEVGGEIILFVRVGDESVV